MYCHGASEFEQSRLTQFSFKALLNKDNSFISKLPSCLVLMSVVYFILHGLWPQIKSNTVEIRDKKREKSKEQKTSVLEFSYLCVKSSLEELIKIKAIFILGQGIFRQQNPPKSVMFLTHYRAFPAASQMPRNAKAWKPKRPASQNKEPF